jgi:predicted permease
MGIIQAFVVIITIVLLGVIFQRAKILNAMQIEGFGIFLLKLAMPCYLFNSTLHHDLQALLYTEYILSFFLSFLIIISCIALIYYRKATPMGLSIKMLAAGYPNAIIYALPIITFLLKDPTAGIIGNILQIVVIQSIFIMTMSLLRHSEHSLLKKLTAVITTPLILAPILGIICNVYHLSVPNAIVQITQHIGNGATSIALFTFGLSIGEVQFNKKTFNKPLLALVAVKNILHPVVAWAVGYYIFNLENYWLYSLVIASSAPTAFVVYLLSKQFQIEEDLMKRTVAISSIVSLFSLLLITIFLQSITA